MVRINHQEVHNELWKKTHLLNMEHEFVLFHQLIDWKAITNALSEKYSSTQGRYSLELHTMVGLLLLSKLRQLGDQKTIELVQENRYAQYFCNVPDENLFFFVSVVPC